MKQRARASKDMQEPDAKRACLDAGKLEFAVGPPRVVQNKGKLFSVTVACDNLDLAVDLELLELLSADTLSPVTGLLVVAHADKKLSGGRASFQLRLVRAPNGPDRAGEFFRLRVRAASQSVAAAVSEPFQLMNYRLIITSVRPSLACFRVR